jgi:glycine C-acetyltransferase
MTSDAFRNRTKALLESLRASGQYKHFYSLTGPLGATAHVEGHGEVLVLCSNNYLGLADHPEVIAAGIAGLEMYGAGTASVRFICGTLACHREIEETIARFAGSERALTYVSCWSANEALIGTVAGENDVLISDELNHASIIDGCRLARKTARDIYRHSDLADLEAKLKLHAEKEVRWVITDGVFSMEGDVARLPDILELVRAHDAILVVDDSHGTGVLGATGRGVAEHFGLLGEVDVITGTLGKALGGAAGGYVASSREVCDLLAQRSRPQLFSNALPPTVACSALRAIELMLVQPELLARLRENTRVFRELLLEAGYAPLDGEAAIVPIIIGETAEAMALSARLLDEGVFVTGFGFPVVPEGTARVRVQMSAALEREHLDRAIAAFERVRPF